MTIPLSLGEEADFYRKGIQGGTCSLSGIKKTAGNDTRPMKKALFGNCRFIFDSKIFWMKYFFVRNGKEPAVRRVSLPLWLYRWLPR